MKYFPAASPFRVERLIAHQFGLITIQGASVGTKSPLDEPRKSLREGALKRALNLLDAHYAVKSWA
jgi:hypothetical protein